MQAALKKNNKYYKVLLKWMSLCSVFLGTEGRTSWKTRDREEEREAVFF
jgi:hypothetical protein